ncbi:MAG: DUF1499 domain-containing protein [Bacteroidetes bacterium]|jgi:uncharacterized protein (DUF1499 family)|nr:DUF1499 domain-containing protein [Bacteroidota bacterium]
MKFSRILLGLLIIGTLILLNVAGPLKGSSNADFSDELQPAANPLPACSGSPNCVRITTELNVDSRTVYDSLPRLLKEMGAEDLEQHSQSLQRNAVFRIPLMGFHDDFRIIVEPKQNSGSVVHISSRSRTGHSDLGVNRRRVNSFLSNLNNHL